MLLHPTLSQLDQLGLAGMAKAFKELTDNPDAKALDHAEWLGLLLDREATEGQDRRLKSRLRNAKLRYGQACVEDIDFTKDRGLDRRLVPISQTVTGCASITTFCWSGHAAAARPGCHAPSVKRRPGSSSLSFITGCPSCSPISRSPAATAAIPASSDRSAAPSC